MKKEVHVLGLGADADPVRRDAALAGKTRKMVARAMMEAPPAEKFHVSSAWVAVGEVTDDYLAAFGDCWHQALEKADEYAVVEVVDNPSSPDEIILARRAIPQRVLLDESDAVKEARVEARCIVDSVQVDLYTLKCHRGVGVSGKPLEHAATWTGGDFEDAQWLRANTVAVEEPVKIGLAVANGFRCGVLVEKPIPVGEARVGRAVNLVNAINNFEVSGVAMRLGEGKALHRRWR